MASREIDMVINGRLVIARPRRTEIEVDVYSGTEKDPEQLVGEWGMPKLLGIPDAMRQAELQTPRDVPRETSTREDHPMGAYTQDELKQVREMREAQQEESARRRTEWNAAQTGFIEAETVYVIEYRHDDDPTWYGAAPFFDPLRVDTDETHDEDEAHAVAVELLNHKRGVRKQSSPGAYNVTGVRVIERKNSAQIISQTETDVPRETTTPDPDK